MFLTQHGSMENVAPPRIQKPEFEDDRAVDRGVSVEAELSVQQQGAVDGRSCVKTQLPRRTTTTTDLFRSGSVM